jgi:GTP cyclohydrolase I
MSEQPKDFRHIDYSAKMPDLDFSYDNNYYPKDSELPDPQLDPVIPGAPIAIQKVGIAPVDLPVQFRRRDGQVEKLHAKVSLYGSLDDANAKGLNLSRFYLLMHEAIAEQMSIEGLQGILRIMKEKQNCKNAFCKLRFDYPWTQFALRTLNPSTGKRQEGHIYYKCELEGQLIDQVYKFYLTVDYIYSSTCPCSFELAQNARVLRGKAANGHSQRSVAKIKIEFDPTKIVWIEDVVELARRQIPTEVVVVCKRRDEQAFAELNGANLIFTEDAVRLLYVGLNDWYRDNRIKDFSIVTEHIESLHPWSAIAVAYKGIPGGLR